MSIKSKKRSFPKKANGILETSTCFLKIKVVTLFQLISLIRINRYLVTKELLGNSVFPALIGIAYKKVLVLILEVIKLIKRS